MAAAMSGSMAGAYRRQEIAFDQQTNSCTDSPDRRHTPSSKGRRSLLGNGMWPRLLTEENLALHQVVTRRITRLLSRRDVEGAANHSLRQEQNSPLLLPTEAIGSSGTNIRKEVWDFLNCHSHQELGHKPTSSTLKFIHRLDTKYEMFSIALVCIVLCLDIIGSVDEYAPLMKNFDPVQVFVGVVFTVEYVLRLWSCIESPDFFKYGFIWGRLRWARKPLALADFAVVAGFLFSELYVGSGNSGVGVIRMVRLLRLMALFKTDRRSSSFSVIYLVFGKKQHELTAALSTALVIMVMSATIMYYIENGEQPDKFSSVPASMWWATAALTTVGYGDMYPVTGVGQLFGGVVAIFGIALFALPAGILGSAYVEVMEEEQEKMHRQEMMSRQETTGTMWQSEGSPHGKGGGISEETARKILERMESITDSVEALRRDQAEQSKMLICVRDEQQRLAEKYEQLTVASI